MASGPGASLKQGEALRLMPKSVAHIPRARRSP